MKIGLARMHAEAGERRDFLPDFVAHLESNGAQVFLEYGYGAGMGLSEKDYLKHAPRAIFTTHQAVYQQEYVLVLRCPDEEDLRRLRPGACLISMLHYPTRLERTEFIRSLGVEAISLDVIKDDSGRRMVENLRAVAWNGMEVAFNTLCQIYPEPGFESPLRSPIQVTQLGSGAVGVHVVQAAIRYGSVERWQRLAEKEIPGVQVTVVDYDTTRHERVMQELLQRTDILVDATQRPNPSQPVIPNAWLAYLPAHAVLLDLSVDPYRCDMWPGVVKGIEGIPQGNLDQYIFPPDDPAYEMIPDCILTQHRRYAISCYSWPGIHPQECMRVYGHQLRPLMRTLIQKGGVLNLKPRGSFFERALTRALLSRWQQSDDDSE